MSDSEQAEAGIKPDLIRVSVGCENIRDIIRDFEQSIAAALVA